MKFTKMQGCGNDYVYVNGFEEQIAKDEKSDLARRISDRHFGVGSDGLIFINPSDIADFEMEMYNGDGSRAEMCGNGIRCVGKYVYDHGMTKGKEFTVESFGAVKHLTVVEEEEGRAKTLRVDMGSPILEAEKVPVSPKYFFVDPAESVVDAPIEVDGNDYHVTCVSMGNPHAVVFIEDTDSLPIESIGPKFENHEAFPNRINTEFVQVIDKGYVKMRVWERGSGETLACGTGCCATAVACILNGKTENKVTVEVLGGKIEIEWDREKNVIYMTGPGVTVFEGDYE